MNGADSNPDIREQLAKDSMDPDLARKYLADQLSPSEEETFELWLAEHTAHLPELNKDMALIEALRNQTKDAPARITSIDSHRRRWTTGSLLSVATAAAIVAFLGPASLLISTQNENLKLEELLKGSKDLSGQTGLVYLETMRSGGPQTPTLLSNQHTLLFAGVAGSNGLYRIVIKDADGSVVGELSQLLARENELTIYVPAGFLPPGLLQVEVHSDLASTPTTTYSLRVE